jgi:DNA-binding NtrC family response regulator
MAVSAKILIVDDEVNIRDALATLLAKSGYEVSTAANGEEAILKIQGTSFDLSIVDLKMPGMGGVELLRWIKEHSTDSEVIVMTAYGSVETAVEAMKAGAYDYLSKPIDKERLPIAIEKALERRRLSLENRQLRESLVVKGRFEQMIGQSSAMKRVFEMVDIVAGSDVTILLTGESGTGKELVARAIHQRGPRSQGPFVTLNCGALPESLFESELFGYEKGAFTGATGTKPGRFELADGGTLFLDEVGEMSLKNQVDFLRILETKEFRRLGGTKLITVEVRVIAATNRNLQKAVEEGSFREDLYYRLNVIPIHLPALREHREDIPVLVEAFLKDFCRIHQKDDKEISSEALRWMVNYSWPGNVRELKNVIERLVVVVKEKKILPEHLPAEIQASQDEQKNMLIPLKKPLKEIEKEVIERVLKEVTSHREKAAKILGISPRALQYKIKEYGIKE